MFEFDVYFRNIEVINYFKLGKVYKLRCWKITKKLQLLLHDGDGCCMYLCDVISSVALLCSQMND